MELANSSSLFTEIITEIRTNLIWLPVVHQSQPSVYPYNLDNSVEKEVIVIETYGSADLTPEIFSNVNEFTTTAYWYPTSIHGMPSPSARKEFNGGKIATVTATTTASEKATSNGDSEGSIEAAVGDQSGNDAVSGVHTSFSIKSTPLPSLVWAVVSEPFSVPTISQNLEQEHVIGEDVEGNEDQGPVDESPRIANYSNETKEYLISELASSSIEGSDSKDNDLAEYETSIYNRTTHRMENDLALSQQNPEVTTVSPSTSNLNHNYNSKYRENDTFVYGSDSNNSTFILKNSHAIRDRPRIPLKSYSLKMPESLSSLYSVIERSSTTTSTTSSHFEKDTHKGEPSEEYGKGDMTEKVTAIKTETSTLPYSISQITSDPASSTSSTTHGTKTTDIDRGVRSSTVTSLRSTIAATTTKEAAKATTKTTTNSSTNTMPTFPTKTTSLRKPKSTVSTSVYGTPRQPPTTSYKGLQITKSTSTTSTKFVHVKSKAFNGFVRHNHTYSFLNAAAFPSTLPVRIFKLIYCIVIFAAHAFFV